MPKTFRQTNSPNPFKKVSLSKNHWAVIQQQLGNSTVVCRFLISKIVFTEDQLTLEEISILFGAFEDIVQKSARDKIFRAKYLNEMFTFRAIFQDLESLLWMEGNKRTEVMKRYEFYRGKLFSARYYYAIKGQIARKFSIAVKIRFPKKFKPKAYIGKGYGDKGTAKNTAYDGNPSWQEVASSNCESYSSSPSYSEKEEQIFSEFRVHNLQMIQVRRPKLIRVLRKEARHVSIDPAKKKDSVR